MMVSFIQSNYMGFGSGIVVPDAGISLQNRGYGFSMDPKSANVVEGGKRPFHTIIPAFLTQQVDGRQEAVMSFGVMGGDMQPQGHLQSIVRMLDYGQQPQAACDAPRWKVNRDFTVDVEATLDEDTVRALEVYGFRLGPVHLEARSQRPGARLCRRERHPARRAGRRVLILAAVPYKMPEPRR
jgi:gamma-glutamyltranspeptidase/glutathione hydrolase